MARFYYVIDLNERGSFRAHVENANTGKEVFEVLGGDELTENDSSLVDDGFMDNFLDVKGLEDYLRQMNVLKSRDTLDFISND